MRVIFKFELRIYVLSLYIMFWKVTCIKCNVCFCQKFYFTFDMHFMELLNVSHADDFCI